MAEPSTVSFFGGLLQGVGEGLLTREERAYQKKVDDTKARRAAVSALIQSGDLTPDQQALGIRALLGSTLQGQQKSTGKGGKGKPEGPNPMDQFFESFGSLKPKAGGNGASAQPQTENVGTPGNAPPPSIPPVPQPGAGASGGASPTSIPPVPQPRTMNDWREQRASQARVAEEGAKEKQKFEERLREGHILDLKGEDLTNYAAGRTVEKQIDQTKLAQLGLMQNDQGQIVPVPDELLPPEIKIKRDEAKRKEQDSEALRALRESQVALNNAREEVAKASNDPKSPAYQLKMKNYLQRWAQMDLGKERLGLAREALDFREFGPTGTARTKAQQADVVISQGQDLLGWIDAHPEAFGVSVAGLSEAAQSRDPLVAEAATRLRSFAALQPALHGTRGVGMQKEFEGAVGKAWSTPEALKARISALMEVAGNFKKAGTYKARGAGLPDVPDVGGTVKMKAPDGTVKSVPSSQVGHYKSLGATVVN